MVLIDCTKEAVAIEQGLDIGGASAAGGEGRGCALEAVELGPYGLVEEQEDQDWRLDRRGVAHIGEAKSLPCTLLPSGLGSRSEVKRKRAL
ncbi:hypothetical protein TIFTF001_007828 [Ficus carica]|uniref:Uncharacterized protein n=1 Tax=Ficus carica TaxID=3494 RepID=A0AA88CXH0_FICCA|nr:hypothetical protein TIFTF001_007828 [Ficus carica]